MGWEGTCASDSTSLTTSTPAFPGVGRGDGKNFPHSTGITAPPTLRARDVVSMAGSSTARGREGFVMVPLGGSGAGESFNGGVLYSLQPAARSERRSVPPGPPTASLSPKRVLHTRGLPVSPRAYEAARTAAETARALAASGRGSYGRPQSPTAGLGVSSLAGSSLGALRQLADSMDHLELLEQKERRSSGPGKVKSARTGKVSFDIGRKDTLKARCPSCKGVCKCWRSK